MIDVRLPNGVYSFAENELLGKGGFGKVYRGRDGFGNPVAVKQLTITPQMTGHRELRIAEQLQGSAFNHVMLPIDAGQDANSDHYFIVMPLATKSLQDEIDQRGTMSEAEALTTIVAITKGILELGDIVHRDLKPGNVLHHDSTWKIADFGLSKFISESTSLDTVREGLTPLYAAPEQWNRESVSKSVDIYALGCIAYALLTGSPPFSGNHEDLRRAHGSEKPPLIETVTPRFASCISMMLRKPPETRPTAVRVREWLEGCAAGVDELLAKSVALGRLAQVSTLIVEASSEEDIRKHTLREEMKRRIEVANAGREILLGIGEALVTRIKIGAPNAEILWRGKLKSELTIRLGKGTLTVKFPAVDMAIPTNEFPRSKWDVVSEGAIVVAQGEDASQGRGASVLYADRFNSGELRWWEIGFMNSPLVRRRAAIEPFPARNRKEADLALSPTLAEVQIGSMPKLMDDEHLDEFLERWIGVFAEAADGQLQTPSSLPID